MTTQILEQEQFKELVSDLEEMLLEYALGSDCWEAVDGNPNDLILTETAQEEKDTVEELAITFLNSFCQIYSDDKEDNRFIPKPIAPKTIDEMDTYEIARYLEEERHTAFILWQTEDVIDKAKEMEISCTEEQAQEILGLIQHDRDCEYGITWLTIESFIDDYFNPIP